ncbi:MAG: hypothetical protein IPH81_00330 [Candidatus Microthrix sp.]|nr:hypothetical protein [Candidatus Microthrix sp.]
MLNGVGYRAGVGVILGLGVDMVFGFGRWAGVGVDLLGGFDRRAGVVVPDVGGRDGVVFGFGRWIGVGVDLLGGFGWRAGVGVDLLNGVGYRAGVGVILGLGVDMVFGFGRWAGDRFSRGGRRGFVLRIDLRFVFFLEEIEALPQRRRLRFVAPPTDRLLVVGPSGAVRRRQSIGEEAFVRVKRCRSCHRWPV